MPVVEEVAYSDALFRQEYQHNNSNIKSEVQKHNDIKLFLSTTSECRNDISKEILYIQTQLK